MTRETRIALLVGLAFIVLFGLVLGQRSLNLQNQSNGINVARTNPGTTVVPVNVPAPAPAVAGSGNSSIIPPVNIAPPPTPGVSPEVTHAGDPPLAHAATASPAPTVVQTPVVAPAPAPAVATRTPTAPTPVAPAPMPPSVIRGSTPTPTEVASNTKSSLPERTVSAPVTPPAMPASAAPATAATYEVQAGDTLYKIAGKLYGKGHESEYIKIYKANQDKISESFALSVGQKLTIPDAPAATVVDTSATAAAPAKSGLKNLTTGKKDATIVDLKNAVTAKNDRSEPPTLTVVNSDESTLRTADSPKAASTPKAKEAKVVDLKAKSGAAAVAATPVPATPVTGKKYVIKSGDSLAAIARNLMGDSSKASIQKIMEANKDRLKDPNQLKIGTELRIPQA